MKSFFALSIFLLSSQVFASHPHDRVCVGEANIAGADPIGIVLQWELGRTYDSGDPQTDNHEISFEASSCWGDYQDSDCIKSKSEAATYSPSQLQSAPVKLKDANGQIFFAGNFDIASEALIGKINGRQGKLVTTQIKLKCVSQPRLVLDTLKD